MRFADLLGIHTSMKHVRAPPLTEIQQYGASNQQCGQNMRRNNLRFLHGTATFTSFSLKCYDVGTSTHVVDILQTKKHPMVNEVKNLTL